MPESECRAERFGYEGVGEWLGDDPAGRARKHDRSPQLVYLFEETRGHEVAVETFAVASHLRQTKPFERMLLDKPQQRLHAAHLTSMDGVEGLPVTLEYPYAPLNG